MERVETGVNGLDEMLNGGIPKNYSVIVMGGPGTGKTLFGSQFVHTGAMKGERGVYITLEEAPERIRKNMKNAFGWDFSKLEKKGLLAIVPVQKYNMQHLYDVIQSEVTQRQTTRVVIDSVTMLKMYFKSDFEFRRNLFDLLELLSRLDCTTVLTAERHYFKPEEMRPELEEFIADGAIALYNLPRKNERVRALEIIKMRGTSHSQTIYPFQITGEGIRVIPEEVL